MLSRQYLLEEDLEMKAEINQEIKERA